MTAIVSTPQTSCNIAILSDLAMKRATVIAERTKSTLAGVTKAMMIDVLKEKMHNGVTHFFYQKRNGELREAFGTLNQSLVAATVNGRGESRENYSTIAYFDCICGAWRSFRYETLVQVL